MPSTKKDLALYIRSFIFGVEDSLVSTVGLVSGIAVAGVARSEIFLTGIVLIFVEAFSMGVGSFLSEESAEEYVTKRERFSISTVMGGIIMFLSYFIAGFVPLGPYIFLDVNMALPASIGASLVALFILGAVSGKIFQRNIFKHGLKMLVLGGMAIFIGIIVGKLVHS